LPDVSVFSFQKGAAAEEIEGLPLGLNLRPLGAMFTDFSDTAAAIMQMDMIISIDTCVAHLAGALGKTVWTLLPYSADWRWLLDRSDSPWYPTMRLFRQPRPTDWASVIEDVRHCATLESRNERAH
jgi:ADP-heptose:LPS heptosyltransferase